jgi:hypothetical protein
MKNIQDKYELLDVIELWYNNQSKAESIYGKPENWDLSELNFIFGDKKNISQLDERDNLYERFDCFDKVPTNISMSEFMDILDKKEVYFMLNIEFDNDAYYQLNDDKLGYVPSKEVLDSFLKDFGGFVVGIFNPLKTIRKGNIAYAYETYIINGDEIFSLINEAIEQEEILEDNFETIKLEDFLETESYQMFGSTAQECGYQPIFENFYPKYSWIADGEDSFTYKETELKIFSGNKIIDLNYIK